MSATDSTESLPRPARRLHIALYLETAKRIIFERVLDAGADVTLGGDSSGSTLVISGWTVPPFRLIERSTLLTLRPGMRVNMCGDDGADRIAGTFEELVASGVEMPIAIQGRRMNVGIREGVSVFAKFVDASDREPERAASSHDS